MDSLTTGASFHPTQKLKMSAGMQYSSNLSGSIEQQLIAAGGVVTPSNQTQLAVQFLRLQWLRSVIYLWHTCRCRAPPIAACRNSLGQTFGANVYTAQVNYTHPVLGGEFQFIGWHWRTARSTTIPRTRSAIQLLLRTAARWGGGTSMVDFNYQQGVQTLLVTYTTFFVWLWRIGAAEISARYYLGWLLRGFSHRTDWHSGHTSNNDSFSTGPDPRALGKSRRKLCEVERKRNYHRGWLGGNAGTLADSTRQFDRAVWRQAATRILSAAPPCAGSRCRRPTQGRIATQGAAPV